MTVTQNLGYLLCLRKNMESMARASIILTKYVYNLKLFSILIKENEVIL